MNTLSEKFRHIRFELAREKSKPLGDSNDGYDFLVPLDDDSHIDVEEWKRHRDACRVRRFQPGKDDMIGRLRRKPGGQWFIDYAEGDEDDETGFRFGEERFIVGEYVSIRDGDDMHTYQVVSVSDP